MGSLGVLHILPLKLKNINMTVFPTIVLLALYSVRSLYILYIIYYDENESICKAEQSVNKMNEWWDHYTTQYSTLCSPSYCHLFKEWLRCCDIEMFIGTFCTLQMCFHTLTHWSCFPLVVNDCRLSAHDQYSYWNVYVSRRHINFSAVPHKWLLLNQTALCYYMLLTKQKGGQSVKRKRWKMKPGSLLLLTVVATYTEWSRGPAEITMSSKYCSVYSSDSLGTLNVKHLYNYVYIYIYFFSRLLHLSSF